jgi:ATP-dependent DNA ligase
MMPTMRSVACGVEGIVSKRKDSRYRSGHSPDWIKSKNPDAPASALPQGRFTSRPSLHA